MRARAHGDTGGVDDGGYVVWMRALDLEGHYRPLIRRTAKDAQRIDLPERLLRIFRQHALVRADARVADGIDVVDRRTQPDRLHDPRRTGLEAIRWRAVADPVLKYFVDHLTAAVERRHAGEQIIFTVEHTDTSRPPQLMAGEDVEVAIEVAHIHVEMYCALRAID